MLINKNILLFPSRPNTRTRNKCVNLGKLASTAVDRSGALSRHKRLYKLDETGSKQNIIDITGDYRKKISEMRSFDPEIG